MRRMEFKILQSNSHQGLPNYSTSSPCRFPGTQECTEFELSPTEASSFSSCISSSAIPSISDLPLLAPLLPLSPAYPLLLGLTGLSTSISELVLPHTTPVPSIPSRTEFPVAPSTTAAAEFPTTFSSQTTPTLDSSSLRWIPNPKPSAADPSETTLTSSWSESSSGGGKVNAKDANSSSRGLGGVVGDVLGLKLSSSSLDDNELNPEDIFGNKTWIVDSVLRLKTQCWWSGRGKCDHTWKRIAKILTHTSIHIM